MLWKEVNLFVYVSIKQLSCTSMSSSVNLVLQYQQKQERKKKLIKVSGKVEAKNDFSAAFQETKRQKINMGEK